MGSGFMKKFDFLIREIILKIQKNLISLLERSFLKKFFSIPSIYDSWKKIKNYIY